MIVSRCFVGRNNWRRGHILLRRLWRLDRDRLTRQQLADRQGISLDRVIQWFALLKLPPEKLEEIAALGDHWEKRMVTEREMRRKRAEARETGHRSAKRTLP